MQWREICLNIFGVPLTTWNYDYFHAIGSVFERVALIDYSRFDIAKIMLIIIYLFRINCKLWLNIKDQKLISLSFTPAQEPFSLPLPWKLKIHHYSIIATQPPNQKFWHLDGSLFSWKFPSTKTKIISPVKTTPNQAHPINLCSAQNKISCHLKNLPLTNNHISMTNSLGPLSRPNNSTSISSLNWGPLFPPI